MVGYSEVGIKPASAGSSDVARHTLGIRFGPSQEALIRNRLAVFAVEKEISVYKERDYEHEERFDHRLLCLDDLLV